MTVIQKTEKRNLRPDQPLAQQGVCKGKFHTQCFQWPVTSIDYTAK